MRVTPDQWLLESVKYFRAIAFFETYRSQTDEELAATLRRLHHEEFDEDFDPFDAYSDLLLLRWDSNRVWWQDTEADVCIDNRVYEETIREWGVISRGQFLPQNVQEEWHSDEGPIEISFSLQGQAIQFQPNYLDDYIDTSILGVINRLIRRSGYQFEIYESFDQTVFVVAVTAEEKRA